jgi:hypothetical protein
MRPALVAACGVLSIGLAQGVRELVRDDNADTVTEPYVPSPSAAPFVSLGYRELAADLLFFRLVGYFGVGKYTANAIVSLVEAIVILDPHHPKIYEWGSLAIMMAAHRAENPRDMYMRTLALLETGARISPNDYKLLQLAGEVYMVELRTDDPVERRAWDEKGAALFDAAVRKPNAPASAAMNATYLRTKLGQKQRAIDNLRELLLITRDDSARQSILDQLAELSKKDSADIASELLQLRKQFYDAWNRDRSYVPPSLYVLIGAPVTPGFDMTDLAAGGVVPAEPAERREPVPP